MTHQHIKICKHKSILFFFVMAWQIFLMQGAEARCDLSKTPLTRENRCAEYIAEDAKLNIAYKQLRKKIDRDKVNKLIDSQRKWISWRNEKCDAIQDKIQCGNSFCDGVAHDSCIIDLTTIRTKELNSFYKSYSVNQDVNFDFKKDYEYN